MDFRERKTIPVLFFYGWRGRGFCVRIQGVTSHTPNNSRNRQLGYEETIPLPEV